MQVIAIKTEFFNEGDSLLDFIFKNIPSLMDGDVLVITSKIIALAEGRTHDNVHDKERLMVEESEATVKTEWGTVMTLHEGRWCAGAGIDESNASGKLVLFPTNLDEQTASIRQKLQAKYKISNLGIVVTDGRSTPLRPGVTSTTVASAGIKTLRSYIGKPDLCGHIMQYSRMNVVDSLSAAAGLVMGEGDEGVPLVIVRGAPVEFTDQPTPKSGLYIQPKDDLYKDVFKKFS